jgi:PAS domain S-box-containing protein
MDNQILGFDVTNEYTQVEIQKKESFPGWLIEDVQGFALFMLDMNGRIIHWNQGAKRLIGYESEEIIGQHFSRLYNSPEMRMQQISQFCLGIAIKQGFYENKGWWVRRGSPNFFAHVVIMYIAKDVGAFVVMVWDTSKTRE